MKPAAAKPIKMTASGLNMLRTVVASYFIALSLGLIQSTDVTALPALVMAHNQANFLANTAIFILAYLVLMGVWLRPAALLLAGYFLVSSGYAVTASQSAEAMSNFWRDLALIAGLMMTYLQTGLRERKTRAVIRKIRTPRKIRPGDRIQPRRVDSLQIRKPRRARPVTEYLEVQYRDLNEKNPPSKNTAEVINIFAA